MDYLRAYGSGSDCDSDTEQEHRSLSVDKLTPHQVPTAVATEPISIKGGVSEPARKLSSGYVSTRRSTRQAESSDSSIPPKVSCDVSTYLSSSQKYDCKPKHDICRVPKCLPQASFRQHVKPVLDLRWHLSDDRLLLSCSLDGTIRLWDALWQKTCIAVYTQDIPLKKVAWVSHTAVVSGGYGDDAFYLDVISGKTISKLTHNSYVTALAVHPDDSNSLLTGNSKSEINRWDLRCCKEVGNYKGAGGQVLDILFLNGSQFVASSDIERRSGHSQSMNVWDYVSGVVLATQVYFEPYSCPVLRLHPSQSVFLAQSNANYLIAFSSNKPYSMNNYKRFEGHSLDGYSVGFDVSNDGSIVCSASADGMVMFYDYSSTNCLKSVPLTNSSCSTLSIEWHPRLSSVVAVSSWSGHIFCLT